MMLFSLLLLLAIKGLKLVSYTGLVIAHWGSLRWRCHGEHDRHRLARFCYVGLLLALVLESCSS